MCHQTVAIGFQTAPQALKRRLVARIVLGQRGAGHEEREPGVDVADGRGNRLRAGKQRTFAGVFHHGAGHRVEATQR